MATQQRRPGSRPTGAARPAGNERAAARARAAAKKKNKMIIFIIELVAILVMILGLYWFMNQGGNGPKVTVLDEEKLAIAEHIAFEQTMDGYKNIALFGVDAVTSKQLYKDSRSDSIMIASINMNTGDIKLCSVYRDTLLNLTDSKGRYEKCNAAYSYGGAEQAVRMLNMNLDMNITDFITVGYKGLSSVIDGLGGVYIDVDKEELKHINNYQIAVADVLKCDYKKVTKTGYQLLNGVQASAYCRIRQTAGSDFQRTARQREVLKSLEDQAKKADLATLTEVFNDSIGDIYTSLESDDILALLKNIADYSIVDEAGFPNEEYRGNANLGARGACVIPDDLVDNVVWLHDFLFNDPEYRVSDTVKDIDADIKADVANYRK